MIKTINVLTIALLTLLPFHVHAQEYTLQYNMKKGDSFQQTSVSDMKFNQEVMGQSIEMGSLMAMKMTYNVTDVQGELIFMDFIFTSIKMEMNMMGQAIIFDTESTTPDNPMFGNASSIFKSIVNVPVNFSVTKQGILKDIKGYEKLQEAMNKAVNANNPMDTQVSQQFSEEAIKNMIDQSGASYFSEKPVKIGESWTKELSMNLTQMNFNTTTKITLLAVDGNIATLGIEAVLGAEDNDMIQETSEVSEKMTISGTQKGMAKIDLRSGWMVEAELNIDMQTESVVNDMKIPLNMTMTTRTFME